MLARIARSAMLLAVAASIGCGGSGEPTSPGDDLLNALMRWGQTGSDSYSITVTRTCDCAPEAEGAVVNTVTDGMIYSRVYASNSTHVPTYLTPLFPTIEEMFDIIIAAQESSSIHVTARYHATHGYPTHVEIDPSSAAGDEITYDMSNLVLR